MCLQVIVKKCFGGYFYQYFIYYFIYSLDRRVPFKT